MLIKLAYLFDDELLIQAWKARITVNNTFAEEILKNVCEVLIGRVKLLPDARSREIITDALSWVIKNTSDINYNVDTKKDALQISPNLIGFQCVMHGIASRLKKTDRKASKVIVDQQSQFNAAQEFVADFYHKARNVPWMLGPGLPFMDLKHMPSVPISCTSGTESIGLELVDIFIWVFKRHLENKELAPELYSIIKGQLHRGLCDEVSINALIKRWGRWFEDLPEPTDNQLKKAKEIMTEQEQRRQTHVVS